MIRFLLQAIKGAGTLAFVQDPTATDDQYQCLFDDWVNVPQHNIKPFTIETLTPRLASLILDTPFIYSAPGNLWCGRPQEDEACELERMLAGAPRTTQKAPPKRWGKAQQDVVMRVFVNTPTDMDLPENVFLFFHNQTDPIRFVANLPEYQKGHQSCYLVLLQMPATIAQWLKNKEFASAQNCYTPLVSVSPEEAKAFVDMRDEAFRREMEKPIYGP